MREVIRAGLRVAGLVMFSLGIPSSLNAQTSSSNVVAWPPVTCEMRPWTRWWWPGSAVDAPNVTQLLEAYRAAGIGGVEITPIYGVVGQEARSIPYLSPAWVDTLERTITEAHSLGMKVDMPDGTGWPFGGPNVSASEVMDRLVVTRTEVPKGSSAAPTIGHGELDALVAVSASGKTVHLTAKRNALPTWRATDESWTIYAVTGGWSGMKVKRAAPGGEGPCVNPFSTKSVTSYLNRFDTALNPLGRGALRAHFHDSFEYEADWSPTLFRAFRAKRGYDLRDHIPALDGGGAPELVARVRTDYRETISDLLLDGFARNWTAWAHRHGSLSRYQAHGSPGNLLDLYAASDIPETEAFQSIGDPRMSKFASSAAHVMGRPLASSETCTWLGEHFNVTLGKVKTVIDRMFVSGINHIVYHGTCYSPSDAVWPGWLFYAATDFEPTDAIWRDFPAVNAYATRCQSILQSGKPDNDILLYWPIHDLWQKTSTFGMPIEGRWFRSQPIAETAQRLWDRGYAFDYVSDRQLLAATANEAGIHVPGGRYAAVVVPRCDFMPLETLNALRRLAASGVKVIFEAWPTDVPGLGDLAARRTEFARLIGSLRAPTIAYGESQRNNIGKGRFLVGGDTMRLLDDAHIRREAVVDQTGVMFVRRRRSNGHDYFIANENDRGIDGWIALADPASAVALMDPWSGRIGVGATRVRDGRTEFYLQLEPGASLILRSFTSRPSVAPAWTYIRKTSNPVSIGGRWTVKFINGGPTTPDSFTTDDLQSWTKLGGVEAQRFEGTAEYSITFDAPGTRPGPWDLDLGDVRESARVRLNGHDLGVLVGKPFHIAPIALMAHGNTLDIEVTNLSANRIRDLDRRKVPWKIFHEINFVDIAYRPFDASRWPIRPSGLLGPVTVTPIAEFRP